MGSELIERINQLSKKSREVGLTIEEKEEQQKLRRQYTDMFKSDLMRQLDNVYIVDKQGHKKKLQKKEDRS